MVEMTSPGVYISETDASGIATNSSQTTAVFAGNFTKGPLEEYTQITSVDGLIEYYGKPTDDNYNDWYQAYNYLQYAKNLLISRACNINGYAYDTYSTFVAYNTLEGYGVQTWGTSVYGGTASRTSNWVFLNIDTDLKKGDIVSFGASDTDIVTSAYPKFLILDVNQGTKLDENNVEIPVYGILLDRKPTMLIDHTEVDVSVGTKIYKVIISMNGSGEAQGYNNTTDIKIPWKKTSKAQYCANLRVPTYYDDTAYYSDVYSEIQIDKEDIDTGEWYTEIKHKFLIKTPGIPDNAVLFEKNKQIKNREHFNLIKDSLIFSTADAKLKFYSKTPGTDASRYKISIMLPTDFEINDTRFVGNHCSRYAFEGISVDGLFEYAPQLETAQIGVAIYDSEENELKETFLVSLDPKAVDIYNKSTYIETVINKTSEYVYVKDNVALDPTIEIEEYIYDVYGNKIQKTINKNGVLEYVTSINETTGVAEPVYRTKTTVVPNVASYTYIYDTINNEYYGRSLELVCASDSLIQEDDLLNAYEIFNNKEDLDIDIVIGNELDYGKSALNLAETRKDCIAYIGLPYEYNGSVMTVGQRSETATSSIIKFRNSINYNSMWISLYGNYKQQYDRYASKNRWINIAGDCAGLRGQCNVDNDPWWPSAGLTRGQIKNVVKLAYAPNQTQRGTLYINGVNPVVTFPGDGTVVWGQKTMLTASSSFDRVNVRCLFNTLERTLAKMSRYHVFELNDTFTRNRVVSSIAPYLAQVQSGRGIQDYQVVCDTSNNTPQIIAENKLVVDIYIKPTYSAEFILLHFINAGTNDFSAVTTE